MSAKANLERNRAALARERSARAEAHTQALANVRAMEAEIEANGADLAAQSELRRAQVRLKSAERAMEQWNDPFPESAPTSAGAPAPSPVVPAACKPSATGAGPLTLEMAEITVAAARGENARCLAIMAEANALGIASEHVDAALAAGISAEGFVERYAPLEALARQIATT